MPIWIANFVLSDYGTGAVMSVPAHDARDFEFARKYSLPIKVVIQPATGDKLPPGDKLEAASTEYGVLVDSGEYTGLTSEEARPKMAAKLEGEGRGKATVTYRQKDWGFSRQRYWGTPIPIVYCEKCDPERAGIPVPLEQLPVRLPEIDTQAVLTGKGEPPLAKVASWVNTTCPKCSGPARREAETMDTFVDSCWYFARYLSPKYDAAPFDPAEAKRWLPVDVYVGGPEHAVMHLLYFRFWTRVMKELGLSPVDEPVTRLVTQGIVNGPDGRKMSKRWGNVVAPASIVKKYGADTARAYVLFAGPPERDFDWSDAQVEGAFRFLKRVWTLAATHEGVAGATHSGPYEGKALEIRRAAHKTLKRVGEAIERLSFNTAIAGIMEYLNVLYAVGTPETPAEKAAMAEAMRLLAVVLTPFAPHIADEVAEAYGSKTLTVVQEWPAFDPALVVDDEIPYAVQVNGKLRAEIKVPADAAEADVRAAAEADERVQGGHGGQDAAQVRLRPQAAGELRRRLSGGLRCRPRSSSCARGAGGRQPARGGPCVACGATLPDAPLPADPAPEAPFLALEWGRARPHGRGRAAHLPGGRRRGARGRRAGQPARAWRWGAASSCEALAVSCSSPSCWRSWSRPCGRWRWPSGACGARGAAVAALLRSLLVVAHGRGPRALAAGRWRGSAPSRRRLLSTGAWTSARATRAGLPRRRPCRSTRIWLVTPGA